MQRLILSIAGLALWLMTFTAPVSANMDRARLDADVHVTIVQQSSDRWRVDFFLSKSVAYLDMGLSLGGFRKKSWNIVDPDIKLRSRNGHDYIEVSKKRRRFKQVSIVVRPAAKGDQKQYEAIQLMGTDGAILYTGHFWPWKSQGGRVSTSFTFEAISGSHVIAFGEQAQRIENWQSPYRHPAFVYFGSAKPKMIGSTMSIVDPNSPEWIKEIFARSLNSILSFYSAKFDEGLATSPDIMLSYDGADNPSLYQYDGDALPGQFQVALRGGGWRMHTHQGEALLNRAIAHEAAHLWQTMVSPAHSDVPGWIHEGAADAIASEALVQVGLWSNEQANAEFLRAKQNCARSLQRGILATAEARGDIRALYDCGQIIYIVGSRGENRPTGRINFWNDLAHQSDAENGYDAETFFRLVERRKGRKTAMALRKFEKTRPASPMVAIDRLLALNADEKTLDRGFDH